MLPPFRALILDLDGLILDTESTYHQAWRQAAAELGFRFTPALARRLSGQSIDTVARILTDAFGPQFDFETFHQLSGGHWHRWVTAHGIAVQPGYERLMAVLREKGLPYILATNSQRRYARQCLSLAGIDDAFPTFVSRDDVEAGKPAPHIHLHACRRLGLLPDQCLVLEDSQPGILAAHRAGTLPVLVSGESEISVATASLAISRFPSLNEVARAISESFGRR